jgi:hypothetical protein
MHTFSLALVVVELFAILSLIKSFKTYLPLMLLPGDRIWQLIYPYCFIVFWYYIGCAVNSAFSLL